MVVSVEANDLETNSFHLPHAILNQPWELETIGAFRKKVGYCYPFGHGKPVNRKAKQGTGKHSLAPRFIGRPGRQSSLGPYCTEVLALGAFRPLEEPAFDWGASSLSSSAFSRACLELSMPVSLELPSMYFAGFFDIGA